MLNKVLIYTVYLKSDDLWKENIRFLSSMLHPVVIDIALNIAENMSLTVSAKKTLNKFDYPKNSR